MGLAGPNAVPKTPRRIVGAGPRQESFSTFRFVLLLPSFVPYSLLSRRACPHRAAVFSAVARRFRPASASTVFH